MCTRWSPEAGMVLLYWESHRTILSCLTWGHKIAGQGLEGFTRKIKASSVISEWSLLAMNLQKKGLKHHKILYKSIGCFGSASNNWPSFPPPSFPLLCRRHLFGAATASQHILWPSALSYWQGLSEPSTKSLLYHSVIKADLICIHRRRHFTDFAHYDAIDE